jgi:antitoxin component of RelBE/YafQ-DinJ toxin-antitoxin module
MKMALAPRATVATKKSTAVTNRAENNPESEGLLTVSLPEELHSSVVAYQRKSGLPSLSEAIRHALLRFDGARDVGRRPSRQVSFRVDSELRKRITRQSSKAGVSMGRIVRVALSALPSNPTPIPNPNTHMAKKKKAAKKGTAKKKTAKKK